MVLFEIHQMFKGHLEKTFHNILLSSRKEPTWKNRSIDYSKWNISQTKKKKKSIPTVMRTSFSEGKLMKQFGNPPLSKRTPHFQLTPYF